MPLVSLTPSSGFPPMSAALRELVREADERIARYIDNTPGEPAVAFVPSDFAAAHAALAWIRECSVAPGECFMEWGCGFGVVASIAAALGFESYGIEIDAELVQNARALARDFDLSPTIVEGSFVPVGGDDLTDSMGEHAWLSLGGPDGYDAIGLEPDDFDVIYAYPWPGEEHIVERLFERYAAAGAVLVTYRGLEGVCVQRKKPRRRAVAR